MDVATVAASSLNIACSSSVGKSKVLSRCRPSLLVAPISVGSPLKLISNGIRVPMSSDEHREVGLAAPVALVFLAVAMIPKIAETAAPGVSPSLKNLLLSVVARGVVLVAIGGVVAAISTFDPVCLLSTVCSATKNEAL
ncbi:hypothetical protein KP509_04G046600 [Ceratopteris richardii]|uniref:Uncharacterized protein n=1 Tax=Ceratopteris richardii TaxID=49495 RepID=A0A8T2UZK6_CERRI|nr:hypothetical protein KP509_04G046600 [Ceratopteris richardii]